MGHILWRVPQLGRWASILEGINLRDVVRGGVAGPAAGSGLLLEDGTFFLLLEDGNFLLLEE